MTISTIRGKIKNFSPKPDKDYYGIQIDKGEEETWINGQGEVPEEFVKGVEVKAEVNQDDFIDIQKIDIIGGGQNEDASSGRGKRGQSTDKSGSNRVSGQGESAAAFTSKQERIMIGAAGNQAAEVLAESGIDPQEEQGKLIEVYGELLNGFYNSMKAQVDDKAGEE